MTDQQESVARIAQEWVDEGYGDDCFWEGFPGCPSDEELTPKMVLEAIAAMPAPTVQEAAKVLLVRTREILDMPAPSSLSDANRNLLKLNEAALRALAEQEAPNESA